MHLVLALLASATPKAARASNSSDVSDKPVVPFAVPVSLTNGCASMIGADFACKVGDGPDLDVCQIHKHAKPEQTCAQTPGCVLAVTSGNWATTS